LRFAGRVNGLPHSSIIHRFSLVGYGLDRGRGVGRGLGVGVHLPAHGVGVGVAVGVGVGVGAPDCAQYLLPVFNRFPSISTPPQTIISLPVQTAV